MRIDLLEAHGGLYLDHDSFVLRHLDSVRYLVITPTDAELLYGNSSLRIARPDGYWNQVTAPTELLPYP